ncbi:uri1, prefoldin-like chaperone, partial [Blyttiomyces sp. JEL0837]
MVGGSKGSNAATSATASGSKNNKSTTISSSSSASSSSMPASISSSSSSASSASKPLKSALKKTTTSTSSSTSQQQTVSRLQPQQQSNANKESTNSNDAEMNKQIEFYKKKVAELLHQSEEKIKTFRKYEEDYDNLDKFLEETPKSLTRKFKVPIGKYAFMEGEIYHTNEVLVLLGDNWFMECSTSHAREIVGRRIEYTKENLTNAEKERDAMKLRFTFSEKSMIDLDGDEVNEDGLKFMEIRETLDEFGNEVPDENALSTIHERPLPTDSSTTSTSKKSSSTPPPSTKSQPSSTTKSRLNTPINNNSKSKSKQQQKQQTDPDKPIDLNSVGDFERKLLEKIQKMEEEEEEEDEGEGEQEDGEDLNVEEKDKDYEDKEEVAMEQVDYEMFRSGLKADDDDDDFNKSDEDGEEEDSNEDEDDDEEGLKKRDLNVGRMVGGEVPERMVEDGDGDGEVEVEGGMEEELIDIKTPGDIYLRMLSVMERAAKIEEQVKRKQKIVFKVPDVGDNDDDDEEISGDEKTKGKVRKPILKDQVVEREDVEIIPSEDFEDYMFGREIAEEYHRKREEFLARQTMVMDSFSDSVKHDLALIEEDKPGSRFRKSKLVSTGVVPPIEKDIVEFSRGQWSETETANTPPIILPRLHDDFGDDGMPFKSEIIVPPNVSAVGKTFVVDATNSNGRQPPKSKGIQGRFKPNVQAAKKRSSVEGKSESGEVLSKAGDAGVDGGGKSVVKERGKSVVDSQEAELVPLKKTPSVTFKLREKEVMEDVGGEVVEKPTVGGGELKVMEAVGMNANGNLSSTPELANAQPKKVSKFKAARQQQQQGQQVQQQVQLPKETGVVLESAGSGAGDKGHPGLPPAPSSTDDVSTLPTSVLPAAKVMTASGGGNASSGNMPPKVKSSKEVEGKRELVKDGKIAQNKVSTTGTGPKMGDGLQGSDVGTSGASGGGGLDKLIDAWSVQSSFMKRNHGVGKSVGEGSNLNNNSAEVTKSGGNGKPVGEVLEGNGTGGNVFEPPAELGAGAGGNVAVRDVVRESVGGEKVGGESGRTGKKSLFRKSRE